MERRQSSRQKQAFAIQAIAIVANPDKPQAIQELPRLKVWLKRRKISVLSARRIAEADAVITLGGDGTILSIAAHAAQARVPVLGVNIGRLGFMTSVDLKALYPALDKVLKGQWTVSERLMLEVTRPGSNHSFLALNDAVIRTGSTTRVTGVDVKIQGEDLGCFIGDGVIVTTTTGSTAYSLAAQGPVVHPEVDALILTPICAHSFTQRPVVFPAKYEVELRVQDEKKGNEVQLALDGQRVFRLKSRDVVFIRKSPLKLKLLQDPRVSYFAVLREKLHWGRQ